MQMIALDLVFSIDSVITAVGLTDHLMVIYAAVIASFVLVLMFSGPIAEFIQTHATLKILALSFLVTIGVTIAIEGLGGHVPKGYIYLPMGFALAVEFLQMRFMHNQKKGGKKKS
jgi:predicted tellurium resistance membrane protein TerC